MEVVCAYFGKVGEYRKVKGDKYLTSSLISPYSLWKGHLNENSFIIFSDYKNDT